MLVLTVEMPWRYDERDDEAESLGESYGLDGFEGIGIRCGPTLVVDIQYIM